MRQSYENALSAGDNIQLTIAQYEQNIFDLQQQANEKRKELSLSLSGAYDALQSQINQWALQYVFISPSDGRVSMSKALQKSQHINMGEVLLNIVPDETAHITEKNYVACPRRGQSKKGTVC